MRIRVATAVQVGDALDVHRLPLPVVEVSSEEDPIAADTDSESLSPPNSQDSAPARRAKLDHLWRHSEMDDLVRRPLHSGAQASSSSGLNMLDRARAFQERQQEDEDPFPPTKWGRCAIPSCRYSLAPHLFGSGQFGGEIRLLCSQFHKYTNGHRNCWYSTAVPEHMWASLPRLSEKETQFIAGFIVAQQCQALRQSTPVRSVPKVAMCFGGPWHLRILGLEIL